MATKYFGLVQNGITLSSSNIKSGSDGPRISGYADSANTQPISRFDTQTFNKNSNAQLAIFIDLKTLLGSTAAQVNSITITGNAHSYNLKGTVYAQGSMEIGYIQSNGSSRTAVTTISKLARAESSLQVSSTINSAINTNRFSKNSVTVVGFYFRFTNNNSWATTYDGFRFEDIHMSIDYTPQYNITYDTNGGSLKPANGIKSENVTYVLTTQSPVRAGYSFKNWNTNANGTGLAYGAGASYTQNADLNLYAQWTPHRFYIEYSGGSADSGAMTQSQHDYGITSYLPPQGFSKIGYDFDYWLDTETNVQLQDQAEVTTYSQDEKTVYLEAQWKAHRYTCPVDLNGGSASYSELYFTYNNHIGQLKPLPTRTGYSFQGLYNKNNLEEQIFNSTGTFMLDTWTKTEDITLIALWQVNTYYILFVQEDTSRTVQLTYDSWSSLDKNILYSTTGHTFQGYYSGQNGTGTQYFDANGNATKAMDIAQDNTRLFAYQKPNTYTITFADYAPAEGQVITVTYGETIPNITPPTREGYNCQGYFINDEQVYTAYGVPIDSRWTKTESITVSSKWSIILITVTFWSMDGSQIYAQILNVPYGSSVTYPNTSETPTRTKPDRLEKYTFIGWTNDPDGGGDIIYAPEDNIVITTNANNYYAWFQRERDPDAKPFCYIGEKPVYRIFVGEKEALGIYKGDKKII